MTYADLLKEIQVMSPERQLDTVSVVLTNGETFAVTHTENVLESDILDKDHLILCIDGE